MSTELENQTEHHLPAPIKFTKKLSVDEDQYQKVDNKSLPVFNQLLQFIPDALVAHEVAVKQYMLVVSEGALMSAKDGIGYRGMSSGIDGKFESHAKLFDPKNLKNLVTLSVALKVVTMAVGQAHLAEISSQLENVNSKLGEIKKFLDNERSSEVDAIDIYLDEYFQSANNGFLLTDIRRAQIENDNRKIDAILFHLNREINIAIDCSKDYADKSFFGSDSYFEKLDGLMQDCFNAITQWIAVTKVKAKSIQALLLSDELDLFEQRKLAFKTQLDDIQKKEISRFRSIWIERIESFSSKTSSDKDLAVKRTKLREYLEFYVSNIGSLVSNISISLDNIDYANNNEILLEMVDGKISGVFLPRVSQDLLIESNESFLKFLGKCDDDFLIVPNSIRDDSLVLIKQFDDMQKEERIEVIKNSSSEVVNSAKEVIGDVGGKIGGVFKKIKW